MSNMSYCRFQNTALDLSDCADALEEIMSGADEGDDEVELLSQDEFDALFRMAETIANITDLLSGIDLGGHNVREQLAALFLGQD